MSRCYFAVRQEEAKLAMLEAEENRIAAERENARAELERELGCPVSTDEVFFNGRLRKWVHKKELISELKKYIKICRYRGEILAWAWQNL